jgi:hypothetical protein
MNLALPVCAGSAKSRAAGIDCDRFPVASFFSVLTIFHLQNYTSPIRC